MSFNLASSAADASANSLASPRGGAASGLERTPPPMRAASMAARYLLESMTLSEAELDGAFLETMGRLKRHDPAQYQSLARLARRDPGYRLLLRRTLLDAIIAVQLAALIEEDDLFELTLENMNFRCRHHDAMAVVETVMLMFASDENESRLGFILAVMNPDSVI